MCMHSADVGGSSDVGSRDDLVSTIKPMSPSSRFDCSTFFPCDPRRWFHRYFMLILMCFLSFGSYYVYDNPAALQKTITDVRKPVVTSLL